MSYVKERDCNALLFKSFREAESFGYKIPDPQGSAAMSDSKRPLDGIGVTPSGKVIFAESKLLKGYQAFAFSRLEDHQIESLTILSEVRRRAKADYVCPLVTLFIWEPRKFLHLFVFDILFVLDRMKTEKSVKKVELERLKERGLFIDVGLSKKAIDTEKIWMTALSESARLEG